MGETHTLQTGRKNGKKGVIIFVNDDHGQACSKGRSLILCSRYIRSRRASKLSAPELGG